MSADDFRSWYKTYRAGASTGIGYTYTDYGEALSRLGQHDREARLRSAVDEAVRFAVDLITAAERGDLSVFRDSWNLDAAVDGRPIGSLTVTIRTADDFEAGTDADIYFGMVSIDGHGKEWLLDKSGHNDFERGDSDEYYLFIQEKICAPGGMVNAYLRMGDHHGVENDWKCSSIRVHINGVVTADEAMEQWFRNKGDQYDLAVVVWDRKGVPAMEQDSLQKYRALLSDDQKVLWWPKKNLESNLCSNTCNPNLPGIPGYGKGREYWLQQLHLFNDHALLRREMFERGLMNRTRDGREYWIG